MIEHLLKYCKLYDKEIRLNELRLHLESSPLYPSFYAIRQSLAAVGIDCKVVECTYEELLDLSRPAILHMSFSERDNVALAIPVNNYIKIYSPSLRKFTMVSKERLIKVWDGIMLYSDMPEEIHKGMNWDKIILSGAVFIIIFSVLNSWLFMVVSSIVGFLISLYIMQSAKGYGGFLCRLSDKIDCHTVKDSSFSKIGLISLDQLSFAYFIAILIMTLLSSVCGYCLKIEIPLMPVCLLFGVSAVIYSIITQFIISKICVFCIAIDIVLMLQMLASFYPFNTIHSSFYVVSFFIFFILLSFTILFAFVITILLNKKTENTNLCIEILRLKRDEDNLNAMFNKSKKMTESVRIGESIGDVNTPLRLEVWLSYDCPFCKKAYQEIIYLCKHFPKIVHAVLYRIDSVENCRLIKSNDVITISSVPQISLNGIKLPNDYKLSDLKYLISDYHIYSALKRI